LTDLNKKDRHCEARSNLNTPAGGYRCKIASSAEKAFSQLTALAAHHLAKKTVILY